ncbi:hypothetical protein Tsubulata_037632 [Turnera subulata]|uniref:Uncharacterized protein n=1 Tax=Turnera subulata TaxID=218843 RepID=A0A9Q0F2Y6_9ROSI|nr:hypothetical protein Tsubulata_037632 [Turnera subulata]
MQSLKEEESQLTKRGGDEESSISQKAPLGDCQADIPIPQEKLKEFVARVEEQIWKTLEGKISKENEQLKEANEDLKVRNKDLEQRNEDSDNKLFLKELEATKLQTELDEKRTALEQVQSDLEIAQKEVLLKKRKLYEICIISKQFSNSVECMKGRDIHVEDI